MTKLSKKILATVMCFMVLTSILTGCGNKAEEATTTEASTASSAVAEGSAAEEYVPEHMTIGVMTYSTTDQEVLAFKSYYVDYLAKAFDVDFLYSEAILDGEKENAFVEQCAAAGAKGIISFSTNNLENLVDKCASYGMYVIMGAGMPSDELFAKVESNEYFLGCTGPTMQAETEAGASMAKFFADKDTDKKYNYLIVSGGGNMGNEMHAERTRSMLETLGKEYGITYTDDIAALSRASESTEVKLTGSNIKITVYPSYPMSDAYFGGLAQLLQSGQFDVVLSTMGPSVYATLVDEAEKTNKKNIMTASVDCFTADNKGLFETTDSTGDTALNFVAGKYGSIVGPAFAAMYNAITGNGADFRDNGKAFKLFQGYWVASDAATYNELYAMATEADKIAYSIDDLKSVIKVYNSTANYDSFKALGEAYSVEDVKARRAQ